MFGRAKILELMETRIQEQAAQYEARIAQLKDQVADLKKLVFTQTSAFNVPLVHLEADAVMSQKEETIQVSDRDLEEAEKIQSEADRIFAGTF